jgi:hypothetical protein
MWSTPQGLAIGRKNPCPNRRMATAKKVVANRRNGSLGRGPKTSAGKARSSRNAWKHGLNSGKPGLRRHWPRATLFVVLVAASVASAQGTVRGAQDGACSNGRSAGRAPLKQKRALSSSGFPWRIR